MVYIIKIYILYIYSSSEQPAGDGLVFERFSGHGDWPKGYIYVQPIYMCIVRLYIIIIIIIIGYVTSNLDRIS